MFASPAILAAADRARGVTLLAEGDSAGALECLQRAADLWRDANAPYDRARTRALLARALLEQGERSCAQGELRGARTAFEPQPGPGRISGVKMSHESTHPVTRSSAEPTPDRSTARSCPD